MGEQIGYGALVERILGIRLAKLETLTDWMKRPLTPAQVEYALDDVRHLIPVRDALRTRLAEKGRLQWLTEESAFYEDPASYEPDPRMAWQRISRTRVLDPALLAVVREVAAWREETAQEEDEPRGRLAIDDVVIEIARRAPRGPQELSAIRGLHPSVISRHGANIVAAVEKGLRCPPAERPSQPPGRAEEPESAVVLDLLEVFLRLRAIEAEIAPSYLGSRKDLAELIEFVRSESPGSPPSLLHGWRRELVGDHLEAVLAGRLWLRVDPESGRVVTAARPA
jgi:ribonuclease D